MSILSINCKGNPLNFHPHLHCCQVPGLFAAATKPNPKPQTWRGPTFKPGGGLLFKPGGGLLFVCSNLQLPVRTCINRFLKSSPAPGRREIDFSRVAPLQEGGKNETSRCRHQDGRVEERVQLVSIDILKKKPQGFRLKGRTGASIVSEQASLSSCRSNPAVWLVGSTLTGTFANA